MAPLPAPPLLCSCSRRPRTTSCDLACSVANLGLWDLQHANPSWKARSSCLLSSAKALFNASIFLTLT